MSEDLWGDISVEKEIKLPVTILKEQASILGEKTNKILEGRVRSLNINSKESVGYLLEIVAPALGSYRYRILTVIHSAILIYPLYITYERVDEGTFEVSCGDEEDFIKNLHEILSSDFTRRVIISLISQSKATNT